MRLLFALLGHLLVTLARLASRGGLRSVVAESLAVKHQLLIMRRSQLRSPNLTAWDRLMLNAIRTSRRVALDQLQDGSIGILETDEARTSRAGRR